MQVSKRGYPKYQQNAKNGGGVGVLERESLNVSSILCYIEQFVS